MCLYCTGVVSITLEEKGWSALSSRLQPGVSEHMSPVPCLLFSSKMSFSSVHPDMISCLFPNVLLPSHVSVSFKMKLLSVFHFRVTTYTLTATCLFFQELQKGAERHPV